MSASDSSFIITQQQLIKSRWFSLLMPMAIIGSMLFLLMALLINLNFHSIKNLAERGIEERLLESASQMAQHLSNEPLTLELLSDDELAAYLDRLALRLVQMSVPWSGYSLLMDATGKLLVFPYQAESDWSNIPWQAMVDKKSQEKFDKVEVNFLKQPNLTHALDPLRLDASGLINLEVKGKKLLLSWSTITLVNWKVINIVAAEKAFIVENQLIDDYRLMILLWGAFLFIMFFVLVFLVFRRDQQLIVNEKLNSLKEEGFSIAPPLVIDKSDFINLINYPLMVCQFDAAGLVVACNTTFEHLVGSTKNNLKGANLAELLGLKSLMINTQKNELELKIGKQDTRSYWVSFHYTSNQEGLILLLDISESKQIQQQLINDKQRTNLAAKMKTEFFKAAVNDANKLLLELIKNAQGSDKNLTSYCQVKLLDLQYLLDDMQDISDASELERKALSEDCLIIDLLIDDCHQLSKNLLADSGRNLVIDLKSTMPKHLTLDRRKLLRLMRHLLRQVIQMSIKGDIYLQLNWTDLNRLQLTLKDQGGGLIESERLRRFQLTTPMSSSYESTSGALGLGQLLTRQLVHEMRGSLNIEALPAGGLQIQIELPARLLAAKSENLVLGRILVVDDGPVNAMLAASVLEKSGYQVDVAENGAKALMLGQEKNYDLVLMDIFMPNMDGLETTRCWRQLPNTNATIPIIALTANTIAVERQRFLQQGMDDYLAKPYKPNELRELVLRWLQKSHWV